MSTTTIGGTVPPPPLTDRPGGPLEERHMRSAAYRNVAQGEAQEGRLTGTHWHIAWANGLGWGFDGMDGAIFALVAIWLAIARLKIRS